MQSGIKFFIIVCFVSLVSVSFARQGVTSEQQPVLAAEANETAVPSFPYIAEVTADDVYVRCGPGTNYYPCGKLNRTDKIKVVGSKFSWSQIVPPAGSFSWVSKQYVSVDADNPAIGIVTGDAVRFYAGSDSREPIHSETVQGKFSRADKVKLMGKAVGDYYKIAPPSGAYLWISTKYTNPLGSVGEFPLAVGPETDIEADIPAVVSTGVSVEGEKLKEYYALQKLVELERAKPITQQDYTKTKKALTRIAENEQAGKAARYSKFVIKQIERFELAGRANKELQLQDEQLQQAKKRIEKALATKLAQVQDLGRFAAVGRFETSNIYGPDAKPIHYRIIDAAGRTVCYALPSDTAPKMDVSRFIGRKVGLVGVIQPYLQTSGALVRFTEIAELK